jgi:hypothetical protein
MQVKRRKTDYGTVVLHWLLVAAVSVAFLTGLRIASEAPDRDWINLLDFLLPQANVWVLHMQAAVVLVAVSIAYAGYLLRSGLSRRVRLDKVRLRGLAGRRHVRLGSLSVLLTWICLAATLTLIITGACLYFGVFASQDVMMLHWYATWIVPLFAVSHIVIHFRIGGMSQLMRIFRPERLPAPPPRLDAVELLGMLAERSVVPPSGPQEIPNTRPHLSASLPDSAGRRGETRAPAVPAAPKAKVSLDLAKRKNVTLQSNPFVVATAIAVTAASLAVASDWIAVDTLRIHRITNAEAPILDGDTSDPVWRSIRPLSVLTNQGGNFDGNGESRIDVRAVHDGTWAYFLFTWEDPTRSLKQLPLIKEVSGWRLLHDGYEQGDEHAFNEDKFSVLLTTTDVSLAGDRTFHASPHPIADAPPTMTGRGLHYTTKTGPYADVWQWKATSGGPTGWMDDDHFGPPLEPTPMQASNAVPYRGGFAPDPGGANYSDNFVISTPATGDERIVTPRRLPRDLAAMTATMGQISLDPNVGESDGARWFMTETESVPYAVDLDRLIPIGTVIPGVIISGDFSGDRADIRCAARWAAGRWSLEVARRLDTDSEYDVPVRTGVFMRVAAFDHSQIRHTRHVRPIRLEVE